MSSLIKQSHSLTITRARKRFVNIFKAVCMAVVLVSFAYILLYPVLYMFANSIKTNQDLLDPSVQWISKHMDFSSFKGAHKAMDFNNTLWNTVRFEMVAAIIEVFTCSLFAYGLARFDIKYKKVYTFILILTILVPDIMLLMPRAMHFKQLDLVGILGLFDKITGIDVRPNIIDTPWAFYLPSIFGVGLKGSLFIFIYMNFFKGLPKELEEAAMIDGAGALRTYLKIIIPSSGVVFLTVFVFSFVWHWNDYYLAMMYTNQNHTLSYMVANIDQFVFITYGGVEGLNLDRAYGYTYPMASCLLYIAIPTIAYLFLQRKFIQSVDRVGIVG